MNHLYNKLSSEIKKRGWELMLEHPVDSDYKRALDIIAEDLNSVLDVNKMSENLASAVKTVSERLGISTESVAVLLYIAGRRQCKLGLSSCAGGKIPDKYLWPALRELDMVYAIDQLETGTLVISESGLMALVACKRLTNGSRYLRSHFKSVYDCRSSINDEHQSRSNDLTDEMPDAATLKRDLAGSCVYECEPDPHDDVESEGEEDDESIFGADCFEEESEPSKNWPCSRGFIDFLQEIISAYLSGAYYDHELIFLVLENLSSDENRAFAEALDKTGIWSLPDDEVVAFLVLCSCFMQSGTEPFNAEGASGESGIDKQRIESLKKPLKMLVNKGFAIMPPDEFRDGPSKNSNKDRYVIAPDKVGIFRGKAGLINWASICRFGELINSEKIEEKVMYFSRAMQDEIRKLEMLFSIDKSAELLSRLKAIGRQAITCLFYGEPGTGKTALAKQLARKTGRDILLVDGAKIFGSYFGETGKNIRELFRIFRYLNGISECPPILLFNEADAIISRRVSRIERASDREENTIQAILLQELEDFDGILIATTNLVSNMDPAVDRRFLFKLRFDLPSEGACAKILADRLHNARPEDIATIAREFRLSGGQLDNLASKCIIEEVFTGKPATLEMMRKFASSECIRDSGSETREEPIGVVQYNYSGYKS